MTDQELDRLMRHVLMDGVEQKSEQPSEADNGGLLILDGF